MKRIYVPSKGPHDWQSLLAEPEKQWKPGFSAMELAECWEAVDGFPTEVEMPLSQRFPGIRPLIAIPELKVRLPGGQSPSQNDIWILARSDHSLVSIAVEGKVEERFDQPVGQWLASASEGKQTRWSFLKRKLGLKEEPDKGLMYQLFHRAASAIIQAEEFRADCAVFVVHSFSHRASWFTEYSAFLRLFGVEASPGRVQSARQSSPVPLHFLWATGTLRVPLDPVSAAH